MQPLAGLTVAEASLTGHILPLQFARVFQCPLTMKAPRLQYRSENTLRGHGILFFFFLINITMFYRRKQSSGALSALFFWTWGAAGTKSTQGKGRSIFCRHHYGLSVVAALQTEYRERSHEFGKTIKAILRERRPRDKFRKLDLSIDWLSTSEVIRPPNNKACCEKVCGIWLEKLMERKQRSSHRDNPAIHCGVGASGNSLREDAMLRVS